MLSIRGQDGRQYGGGFLAWSGDLELLVAEVGDELEGSAERGDEAVQDVLGGDVAAFDLGDPGDRDAHPSGYLLLGHPAPLTYLGQPPAAGAVQHRGDRRVERLLAACSLDRALQVAGVPPARYFAHRPIRVVIRISHSTWWTAPRRMIWSGLVAGVSGMGGDVADHGVGVAAFGVEVGVGVVFGDAPHAVLLVPVGRPTLVVLEEADDPLFVSIDSERRPCRGRPPVT